MNSHGSDYQPRANLTRDLFRNRKVGVVTLVMSLVVMGGWIRSYAVFDMVSIGDQVFGSTGGCLLWYKASYESSDAFLWWHHQAAWAVAEQWNFGPGVWKFPYWVITIPLTLLSAYLILWKPQRPAQ